MKILSWNVNGIRACGKKGFWSWLEEESADIVCLQEIKAKPEQLPESEQNPPGYVGIWNPAQKAGYSGTAVFSKKEPLEVSFEIGLKEADQEGRVMILKYPKFTLINSYFPNSQRDHARLPFKLKFCQKFLKKAQELVDQGENVIMCADWNIAPTEIDLKNPKTNKKNAGFLPEERDWMSQFIDAGFVDAFRHFYPDKEQEYTWWSYRPGIRERNIGWRLDYFMMNESFTKKLKSSFHQPKVMGSDHCPVGITLKK